MVCSDTRASKTDSLSPLQLLRFVPSQLERASGFIAQSLSAETRGLCHASVACARGVGAILGGRQRPCGMKLAGDSGKSPYLKGVRAMKIMPECGTMRENEAAFDMAVAAITSGDLAWGHCILVNDPAKS